MRKRPYLQLVVGNPAAGGSAADESSGNLERGVWRAATLSAEGQLILYAVDSRGRRIADVVSAAADEARVVAALEHLLDVANPAPDLRLVPATPRAIQRPTGRARR